MTHTHIIKGAAAFTVAAGLSLLAAAAFADDPADYDPTTMAPPVQSTAPLDAGVNAGTNTSADSVFNWQEIPANQQVPLTRAAFDQGGYQLYDTVGETIIVPFTNQNLYVMKFAQSTNGTLYFMNEGGCPVLYVPRDGYLDNATVSGSRWYPFGQDFHPSEPVFLGVAPSYPEFIDMGWYPDMVCYGGYYSPRPYFAGDVFLPTIGLFFEIGGHSYHGWDGYHHYRDDHPDFHRTDYYNRDFYHFAGRPSGFARPFNGAGRPFYAHRTFGGSNDYAQHRNYAERPSFSPRSGDSPRFGDTGRQTYTGHQGFSDHSGFPSGRTFRGTEGFGQGSPSFGGRSGDSGRPNFGGRQGFGGNQGDSGTRSYQDRAIQRSPSYGQSDSQSSGRYGGGPQSSGRGSFQGGSNSGQSSRGSEPRGGQPSGVGQRGGSDNHSGDNHDSDNHDSDNHNSDNHGGDRGGRRF